MSSRPGTARAARAAQLIAEAGEAAAGGRAEAALRAATAALALCRDVSDAGSEAEALAVVVRAHVQQGQPAEARLAAGEGLERLRAAGEKAGEAKLLLASAEAHEAGGAREEAVALAGEARSLSAALGDRGLQARACLLLASIHRSGLRGEGREKAQRALRLAQEALDLSELAGDLRARGLALQALAAAEALGAGAGVWAVHAEEALELFRRLGDQSLLAQGLQSLAQLRLEAREPEEALRRSEEALEIFLERGERRPEEAEAVACAVRALVQLDCCGSALRLAKGTAEAFQEAGVVRGEAAALELLASVCAAVGRGAAAERAAHAALRLYGRLKDEAGEARMLRAVSELRLTKAGGAGAGAPAAALVQGAAEKAAAALYEVLEEHLAGGRSAEALAEATALRARCRSSGERLAEGIAMMSLCTVHLRLAEYKECLRLAREAAEIFEEEARDHWWACALAVIAQAYMERQQYQMVQQYARNASRKFASAGDKQRDVSMRFLIVHSMLVLPDKQRRLKEAMREAEAALALAREVGNRDLQVTALGLVTKAHTTGGQHEDALKAARKALELVDNEDTHSKAKLLLHCADMCIALKRYDEALLQASEVLALAEKDGDAKFMDIASRMLQTVERCQQEAARRT